MRWLRAAMLVIVGLSLIRPGGVIGAQELEIGSPPASPEFNGEFTDVSDYWTIAWNDDWYVTSYSALDYGELLQLSDGVWTVRLQGPIYDSLTDATVEPGDARTALIDLGKSIGVSEPMYSENGRPLQHFSPGRAWRVYEQENGEPIYLDVRKLDDSGAFLSIMAWVEGGIPVFNEHYQQMLLLLENLRLLR